MPPLRTFTPIKAIKTERTHEENQERAYIAASRRSDRSLEARVESARRASEIHKRRTGRSLRVTEQDVINEEMYEEEDDDLPSQYRRLTAHLQTGSADFNRRLAAYLTNHVAMRSALDQAITNSFAQQFPDAPQFAHNHPGLYPSPLLTQGTANLAQMEQQTSPTSPHPYRQVPYPMPGMAGYRQHQRSGSTALNEAAERPSVQSPGGQSAPTPVLSPLDSGNNSKSPSAVPSKETQEGFPDFRPQRDGNPLQSFSHSISPLTTTLPPDSQLLLGPALDPNDPFNTMLMGGHDPQMNFYDTQSYGQSTLKDLNFHPNIDGMNTTLAPSASQSSQPSFTGLTTSTGQAASAFDQVNFDILKDNETGSTSDTGSGNATPGVDGTWDAFINDNGSWAENAT